MFAVEPEQDYKMFDADKKISTILKDLDNGLIEASRLLNNAASVEQVNVVLPVLKEMITSIVGRLSNARFTAQQAELQRVHDAHGIQEEREMFESLQQTLIDNVAFDLSERQYAETRDRLLQELDDQRWEVYDDDFAKSEASYASMREQLINEFNSYRLSVYDQDFMESEETLNPINEK